MVPAALTPPSGSTNTVACRMSGEGFTSVTVTDTPTSSGSRMSVSRRISESAWRSTSPTRNCRCEGPFCAECVRCRGMSVSAVTALSERALDGFDLVALDDVALLDLVVIGESHAAFLSGLDFAHLVLEALQRRELAFVDHHVVAHEPHLGAAPHQPLGDAAAGHLADLGDVEHFEDQGIAEEAFARLGRQHA